MMNCMCRIAAGLVLALSGGCAAGGAWTDAERPLTTPGQTGHPTLVWGVVEGPAGWETARNDVALGAVGRLPLAAESVAVTHIVDHLRVSNGRPHDHSRHTTRAIQVRHRP